MKAAATALLIPTYDRAQPRGRGIAAGPTLTRIAAPIVIGLAALATIAETSGAMSLVAFVAAWVALDVAALKAGHDSRERSGWTRPHVRR